MNLWVADDAKDTLIEPPNYLPISSSLRTATWTYRFTFFTPREASGALRRRRTGGRQTLIHHKSVSSKLPNHHIYTVSAFHQPALVRERHPVGLARLGCAALP